MSFYLAGIDLLKDNLIINTEFKFPQHLQVDRENALHPLSPWNDAGRVASANSSLEELGT